MTKAFSRHLYRLLITPFDAEGALDVAALEGLYRLAGERGHPRPDPAGVHRRVPVDDGGRARNRRALRDRTPVAGRVPVLDRRGRGMDGLTPCAPQRMAQKAGADGVMIIPPYYSSPTEDELYHQLRHHRRGRRPADHDHTTTPLYRECRPDAAHRGPPVHDSPNVSYIKESTLEVTRIRRYPGIVRRPDDRLRRHPRLRILRRRGRGLGFRRLQHHAGRLCRIVHPDRRMRRIYDAARALLQEGLAGDPAEWAAITMSAASKAALG